MLPKAHLTFHHRTSRPRWVITPLWLSGSWRPFLYSSSVYSCHLFLISSTSIRSIPFLSFIVPVFAWSVPFVSLIFLKRSLVFSISLFSSISLHWLLWRLSYLSLLSLELCTQMGVSFSPLPFTSLLFIAVCKPSSDNHFAFCISFSCGWSWSLPLVQCHEHVHCSSGTPSVRSNSLNLFLTSTL